MHGLSFVVPMYNEEEIINRNIMFLIAAASSLTDDFEIIVVDDGSIDGGPAIIKKMAEEDNRIRLISLRRNTRFAGALKKGFESAKKEIIIYTDADLGINEDDIKKTLSLIEKADIVNTYSKRQKGETPWRMVTSVFYNFLVRCLFKLNIRDINSSFKVFRHSVLDGMELISNSPFIDAEILIKAKKQGCCIAQIAIDFEDSPGASVMARPLMILAVFMDIFRFRLLLWKKALFL